MKISIKNVKITELYYGDIVINQEYSWGTCQFHKVINRGTTILHDHFFVRIKGMGKYYEHEDRTFQKVIIK